MGSNFLLDWGTINQEFAAGNIGMYTSGSDVYTALVRDFGLDPDDLRPHGHPARGRRPGHARRRRHRRGEPDGRRRPTKAAGGQVDRLLLHAEADRPGCRGRRRQDARRQRTRPSARRCCRCSTRRRTRSRRAGSRTTSTCRVDQMSRLLRRHLRADAGRRGQGQDAGGLRAARPGGAGRADRPERRHRRPARRRPDVDAQALLDGN